MEQSGIRIRVMEISIEPCSGATHRMKEHGTHFRLSRSNGTPLTTTNTDQRITPTGDRLCLGTQQRCPSATLGAFWPTFPSLRLRLEALLM